MSDIIQLLPDSVANQIAAGEVIQRPASVVKELVENAVDAGADKIDVIIIDAGRTLVQVIDNGKGMTETDARLSFERHATSKIRQADDLFSLHTMGFRGEALASIAAVAKVELMTRQANEELGTHITLSASKFVKQEPCSCSVGSNFKVENLFFNVPARRKFLKTNATELNNIVQAFERIVLVYPNISFTLYNNNSELFNFKAGGLRQRIVDVFGKRINQDLMPIDEVKTTMCTISGYVGKPESAKKKGYHQFFFVNQRYMKHPYFHKAVMTAFERLVPTGEQISYFLYFEVSPNDIDVNIHPTKTEIKFENEQAIWQIISAAVKEAVGLFNDVPSIDFDTKGQPDIPIYNPLTSIDIPKVDINPAYNPFEDNAIHPASTSPIWQQSLENSKSEDEYGNLFSSKINADVQNVIIEEKSPAHYQYKGCYIMTAVKSGLMIIDQHRAHVRILYEKYLRQIKAHKAESQKLLFPEIVEIPAVNRVLFELVLPELRIMGFDLTPLGDDSYAINAMPAGLDGLNGTSLVLDIVATAMDNESNAVSDINHSLALSLARNAAIPEGQVLSNKEMENIIDELFSCSDVNHTPDGKTIIGILCQTEIEHLFS